MNISIFDCKPLKEGVHSGKDSGHIETVVSVNALAFIFDKRNYPDYKGVLVYQAFGKFNNMFVTHWQGENTMVIADFHDTIKYLLDIGIVKKNERELKDLQKGILKKFSLKLDAVSGKTVSIEEIDAETTQTDGE